MSPGSVVDKLAARGEAAAGSRFPVVNSSLMKRAKRAGWRRLSPLLPARTPCHTCLAAIFCSFGQVCLQRLGEELIRGLSEW